MRKWAGITIASFTALVIGGAAFSSPVQVGGQVADSAIVIEKVLVDGDGGELPTSWSFRIDSVNCGASIFPNSPGEPQSTVIVSIDGGGGNAEIAVSSVDLTVIGNGGECTYRVQELPADGWNVVDPPTGVVNVTPGFEETVTVVFQNRPVVTTTTTIETTTTVAETTTTVAETTTTVADTTTTAAPTTMAPTTTGTVAPELPPTGASNTPIALLAGLLVLGGLGAVAASRRA